MIGIRYILFWLIILYLSHLTNAWRHFWKGRKNGGNLGHPSNFEISDKPLPQDEWFTQNLDHFNPINNETWQQRFYVNDEYYKSSGPVFLMIGGEGEATAKWMVQGAWIQYAKEHNALCFQLEHRYYGKSYPTEDLSTENLVYLNSEQALADLAFFITAMNEKYKLYSRKWIAFGGSYPGSLAAWLREKYSHLVHGAISSSGPLLAKADFTEYFDVVVASLGTFSDDCVKSVKEGISQVDILMKHRIGQKSLNQQFKLCTPIENSVENRLDISNFYENLAGNFASVVQYNKDNSPHATVTIDNVCSIMVNTSIGASVSRLAAVNDLLLNISNAKCLDYKYDKMIKEMKNSSLNSSVSTGARQWTYQTCTEFGFYQTSNTIDAVFGDKFNLDFFVKQCVDVYGTSFNNETLDKSIKRTNIYYGALNPQTTNVIYVHGSIDPWHALGLISSEDSLLPTVYIKGIV